MTVQLGFPPGAPPAMDVSAPDGLVPEFRSAWAKYFSLWHTAIKHQIVGAGNATMWGYVLCPRVPCLPHSRFTLLFICVLSFSSSLVSSSYSVRDAQNWYKYTSTKTHTQTHTHTHTHTHTPRSRAHQCVVAVYVGSLSCLPQVLTAERASGPRAHVGLPRIHRQQLRHVPS